MKLFQFVERKQDRYIGLTNCSSFNSFEQVRFRFSGGNHYLSPFCHLVDLTDIVIVIIAIIFICYVLAGGERS